MNKILARIKEAWEIRDTLDFRFALEELAKEVHEGKSPTVPAEFPRERMRVSGRTTYVLEPCDTGKDWLLIVPGHVFTILEGA